jgi:hypothetical protein
MAALRRILPLAWLVMFRAMVTPCASGADPASAGPDVNPARAGLLTVTGTVRLPDGSPAVGATVTSNSTFGSSAIVARTNDAGRFRLDGVFGEGARLHIDSADGKHQAIRMVSPVAIRVAARSPVEITLSPAVTHEVTVLSDGGPVKGAQIAGSGTDFKVQGVTGQDGKAQLQHPAVEPLQRLSAWHPVLGASGMRDLEDRLPHGMTQLTLLAPGPHTIRVVDPDGKAIGGLELALNAQAEGSDWIVVQDIEAAHVRTDAQGIAIVPWFPREKLKFVEVELISSDWKIDATDRDQITHGLTTVHARRAKSVQGRLVMPDGASAEGILVGGYGFGPGDHSDIPFARAQRDGSFTLRVFSDHGYLVGITDLDWASNLWTGMIIGKDTSNPAEIAIKVYAATPLTARVTRGPERVPIADARVDIANNGNVKWIDSDGRPHSGTAGVFGWLKTDAKGIARAGVGKGEQRLELRSGTWTDGRKIKVTSIEPLEVEFHRPWLGKRKITGRLMLDKAFYQPSPALVARAWTPDARQAPLVGEPKVYPNGGFEVAVDAEHLILLFVDPNTHRSGFATLDVSETSLDVAMEPTATYSGTILDENAHPLVDRTVRFFMPRLLYEPVAAQRTDKAGWFRFADLPANVPLSLAMDFKGGRPDYNIEGGDRVFQPGELRENDPVKPRPMNSRAPIALPAVALSTSVDKICRDAGSSHMRALVVLEGDASPHVLRVTGRLLDYDQVKSVLAYLTLRVEAAQLKTEAATLAGYGWPIPAPGEFVLVALKGNREMIASERVATDKIDPAAAAGEAFLKQHVPPARDALLMLSNARKEARTNGRRVWIVEGGPRCGPCFRLARWIEDHHATLEKDYVIVKVMDGLDDHAREVIDKLPIMNPGIPWHAITEPDGKILVTSEGPLGNIGFPGSVEGIRHFRRMLERTVQRLTSEEVDSLVKSLSPGK